MEDIVAKLHALPGVAVKTRIKLPSVLRNSTRKREIDVLLETSAVGYPIRIAIECKNYKGPVKSEDVDAFLSKLDDVGIPRCYGVFITASGFRRDALSLAKESGLRPLILEGLNEERLGLEINRALQSIVFLLVVQTRLTRFEGVGKNESGNFPISYFSPELGEGTPAILTHLWQMWVDRRIPDTIGSHLVEIRMPASFRYSEGEPPFKDSVVIASMKVAAHVAGIPGTARSAFLRNATTSELEKMHVAVEFDEPGETLELVRFETEKDLESFVLKANAGVVTRVRVPRIVSDRCFWPPTGKALKRILELRREGMDATFERIEGENLMRAWEIYDAESGYDGEPGGRGDG